VFDIVSAGHFAVDSIFLPERKTPFVVLGGSVTYVSLAARRLDARVSVISKVGGDFPEAYRWWLGQEGVDLSNVVKTEETRTTHFELKYNSDLSDRDLRSECRMSQITVEDVPNPPRAKAVHVGPVAGEVAYDLVEKLRNCGEVTSLDPQGLVRRFDGNGNVTLGPLVDERVLGLVDIFKSSLSEVRAVTGLLELEPAVKAIHDHGVKIVIITLGSNGAAVSVEDTIHNVPAYRPERFVDPTGAGDAFIGGFLAEYVRGEDCSWCSCVGAAVASLVVEGVGPTFFGDREEIIRRARVLYEKEIKE
jgi:sugar/nucleoside kinase (ribokinase family)